VRRGFYDAGWNRYGFVLYDVSRMKRPLRVPSLATSGFKVSIARNSKRQR
jgi:hypothetical protein